MFVNFSEETQHVLKQAGKEMMDLNHPYVGSEHLFLAILKENNALCEKLKKHRITYKTFKDKLISIVGKGSIKSKYILYTPLLKRIIENAAMGAREDNNSLVNPEILIISILDEADGIAYSILKSLRVNVDRLSADLRSNKHGSGRKKRLMLEELGTDLTKLAKENKLDPVIGRDKEVRNTIEILLRRKKNNPILIGPAGVGKTAIVEGLAKLISNNSVPNLLKDKKIIALNIFSLVAGTKYRGEFEEKMKTIIKELEENDDIILFIDEIHTMVGAGGAEGAVDASNIFKPALARGLIKVIGATTLDEYKKFIEPDAALSRRFQKVDVEEPDNATVMKILMDVKSLYESYHNIKISNKIIKEIVDMTNKYISDRFEPDRSIDVLDEVCARTALKESFEERQVTIIDERLNSIKKEKNKALYNQNFKRAYALKQEEQQLTSQLKSIKPKVKSADINDVVEVIKSRSKLPLPEYSKERLYYYKELENKLNARVLGQEESVKSLIYNLKRNDFSKSKKDCNVILIMGPHGCGKTLLAKSYAKEIVNDKKIIELDLSEYHEAHTISKLIGTTAGYLGYDNKNNVFEKIRTNPYSVLILDNIEKASSEVISLFTQIIEQGKTTDASGKDINFKNATIIITATTSDNNKKVGFENNNTIGELSDAFPKKILNLIKCKININKPTDMVVEKIVLKKVDDIIKNYEPYEIKVTNEVVNDIKHQLLNSDEGLLALNNLINSKVESKIVDSLINGESSIIVSCDKKSNVTV